MLTPPNDDEQARVVDWISAAQRIDNLETVRKRKDGSDVHVALTVLPIRESSGKVMAGTAIVRDSSAARHAAEQLKASDEKLRRTVEQTQRALREQQLAADSIRTSAERLLQMELAPGQKELVDAIRHGAIPLQDAIRQLLQLDT